MGRPIQTITMHILQRHRKYEGNITIIIRSYPRELILPGFYCAPWLREIKEPCNITDCFGMFLNNMIIPLVLRIRMYIWFVVFACGRYVWSSSINWTSSIYVEAIGTFCRITMIQCGRWNFGFYLICVSLWNCFRMDQGNRNKKYCKKKIITVTIFNSLMLSFFNGL